MLGVAIRIRETNIIGSATRQFAVSAEQCRGLASRGIDYVGSVRIVGTYEVVRLAPDFEHLTLCTEGSGYSLQQGRWVDFPAGHVAWSPRGAPHGARSRRGTATWALHWMSFASGAEPRIGGSSTSLTSAVVAPVARAIDGLLEESTARGDPRALDCWSELVAHYCERMVGPKRADARLARLFEEMSRRLREPWSLAKMGRLVGLSSGHLRRLCRAELGWGPAEQLTRLRMDRALVLLATGHDKIETIAQEVGYQSAFAFSTAFRRHVGRPPSALRSCRVR
jgi:AraC-like DNA-binding protein